jgi:hypothetical protein
MCTPGSSCLVSPTIAPYSPTDYISDDPGPPGSRLGGGRSRVILLLEVALASAAVTSMRGLRASICSSQEPFATLARLLHDGAAPDDK